MNTSVGNGSGDSLDDEIKKYFNNVMDILQVKFRGHLIFVGIVQDGKLLEYRKGIREEFALPPASQDALDVKLSLVVDVAKTLEGMIGSPKIITIQFQNHDLVVMAISRKRFIYTLSVASSAQMIARLLMAISL